MLTGRAYRDVPTREFRPSAASAQRRRKATPRAFAILCQRAAVAAFVLLVGAPFSNLGPSPALAQPAPEPILANQEATRLAQEEAARRLAARLRSLSGPGQTAVPVGPRPNCSHSLLNVCMDAGPNNR